MRLIDVDKLIAEFMNKALDYDSAIELIESMPTFEVSEDCISRAELRKSLARPLENNNTDEIYWKGWHDCTVAVETRIADAPSVVK